MIEWKCDVARGRRKYRDVPLLHAGRNTNRQKRGTYLEKDGYKAGKRDIEMVVKVKAVFTQN